MALPFPIGRQKEVLYLPAKGHTVVLGTAGSGKTTLAILRAAYLSHGDTTHRGRTLLLTFNKTLVAYLRHLGAEELQNVKVENYHRFARGYLNARGKMGGNGIAGPAARQSLIDEAAGHVQLHGGATLAMGGTALAEELRWIAQHGLKEEQAYVSAQRVGRQQERIQKSSRQLIWKVYQQYRKIRSESGRQYDWDDLASAVLAELDADTSERLYRHIVIDEGQDFSPEMIRSVAKAIPANGSVTLFGDVAQQIYGHRLSWRSAGLQISKVWQFKDNYRNSAQIASLALAISRTPHFAGEADIVEPVAPKAAGPLPTVISFKTAVAEVDFVVKQAVGLAASRSVAILFRKRSHEDLFKSRLPTGSVRLHADLHIWPGGAGISYGTFHSAKGLEFDAVLLPFCDAGTLPDADAISTHGAEDAAMGDARLLYVGVTRAKSSLIITHTGPLTPLFPIDAKLYHRMTT